MQGTESSPSSATVHPLLANPYDHHKYLGTVSQIGKSSVRVALSGAPQNGSANGAEPYEAAEVGQYVVVSSGKHAIFGQISDIRLVDGSGGVGFDSQAVATIQLLSSIETTSGFICAGVVAHPKIGSSAFVAHPKIVQLVAESKQRKGGQEAAVTLSFGHLPDIDHTPVHFTPEMLFGRHCALLGTTGAGKSWSVARLVEEISRFRAKVILLDATGEFGALTRGTHHVHLGRDPNAHKRSTEVSLPYNQLTESDLFAIFKPRGQSQAPKLRAAMKSLKLARLSPKLALDGCIIKVDKSKLHYEAEYSRFFSEIEKVDADFDITKLTRQIENECVKPQRSPFEPEYWGGVNGADQSLCVPLITRINDIIGSENLEPIFKPDGKPSLITAIDRFVKDENSSVLRVNLQYLSFQHNAREIIANAAGRHLLKLAREARFREKPLVVIVDEAHQFLNRTTEGKMQDEYPLDAFADIAKEGRKYALSICIATQRPRDIPEGVLSQMGTLIVHRLINHLDRAVVERASGEIDKSTLESLPTLAPGEAVIIGVDFPVPLLLRVNAPKARPDSAGADYQRFWR
ncbi:MAG: ATP-binding protein [Bdellovibrionales bacterium]|nr:ATP-binding protein [Bdellovibrionales bacterium]